MPKAAPDYRTDHLSCPLNAGKLVKVRELVLTLRRIAKQEARLQWQQFYQGGWQDFETTARKGWTRPWIRDGRLNVTFSQLVMCQVAGALQGYFGNVQNTYTELVSGSKLPAQIRHQLHFINRRQAWFWPCPIQVKQAITQPHPKTGKPVTREANIIVSDEVRALARGLIRRAMACHRKPHFRRFQPQLDQRVCLVQAAHTAQHPDWLVLSTLERGARLAAPLQAHPGFLARQAKTRLAQAMAAAAGEAGGSGVPMEAESQGAANTENACAVDTDPTSARKSRNPHPSRFQIPNTVRLQLSDDQQTLIVGVVTDMREVFAHQASSYQPLRASLTLDFGICTLFASDEGELHGRAWMQTLLKFDRLLTGIARHRQRLGLKTASERYRYHAGRLRGWLKTEINRILNAMVRKKRPAMLIVEALDFRNPNLSRRLNRLVQNAGRGLLTDKLAELEKQYGIAVEHRNAAYSSQECHRCGYVARNNRPSQDIFKCRFCGTCCHADVNAARVVRDRRSVAVSSPGKARVRATLVERINAFNARFPRPRGGPADPRWSNPYFREWANQVRSTEAAASSPSLAFGLA